MTIFNIVARKEESHSYSMGCLMTSSDEDISMICTDDIDSAAEFLGNYLFKNWQFRKDTDWITGYYFTFSIDGRVRYNDLESNIPIQVNYLNEPNDVIKASDEKLIEAIRSLADAHFVRLLLQDLKEVCRRQSLEEQKAKDLEAAEKAEKIETLKKLSSELGYQLTEKEIEC